jgi:hypothetical protein
VPLPRRLLVFRIRPAGRTVPFPVRVTPKFGIGYGFFSEQQTNSSTTVVTASQQANLSGLYLILGLEVDPVRWLQLMADFALSLGTSGTANINLNSGSSTSTGLSSAFFNRLRFGGGFRITDHLTLGGQFILRSISWGGSLQPASDSEIQALGYFGFEW